MNSIPIYVPLTLFNQLSDKQKFIQEASPHCSFMATMPRCSEYTFTLTPISDEIFSSTYMDYYTSIQATLELEEYKRKAREYDKLKESLSVIKKTIG